MMVAFRARRDVVTENSRLTLNELLERAQLEWHGIGLHRPDWGDDSHSIAFTVASFRGRFTVHAMLNAYWEPLIFEVPPTSKKKSGHWRRWVDTSLASPDDICDWKEAVRASEPIYLGVRPRNFAG
jgi:glycogen operon protein